MTISNLNIFVPNTLADVEPVNENFEILRLGINSTENKIGDLGSLATTQKGSLTAAINDAITITNDHINLLLPVGTILTLIGSIAPTGYLLCDGSAISRTAYKNLYDLIGITYGGGDGTTTFQIPDFRGVFLRGLDNGRGFDSGRTITEYQEDGVPNIKGTLIGGAYDSTASGAFAGTSGGTRPDGANKTATLYTLDASKYSSAYKNIPEVRPKNMAVNFYIRY